jgi:hypothetical protein
MTWQESLPKHISEMQKAMQTNPSYTFLKGRCEWNTDFKKCVKGACRLLTISHIYCKDDTIKILGLTHCRGDRLTSVIIPAAFITVGFAMLANGLHNMYTGGCMGYMSRVRMKNLYILV